MSQVITKRTRLSRRIFLKGLTATHLPVMVGIPPLVSMFNSTGTAYAAEAARRRAPSTSDSSSGSTETAFPNATGSRRLPAPNYDMTPCLTPIGRLKDDVLVLSGLDNTYGGNGHPQSLCALMTCTRLSSTGPGAPSLDQVLAAKIGGNSRFRSLQIGVSQESFGGAIQKNMSWAGPNRPLPPEEIPHRLFDRLFGARDLGWVNRKRSILDALARDGAMLRKGLPKEDEMRLDEHLSSIRDLERAIASLPPDYQKVTRAGRRFRHEGLAARRQTPKRYAGLCPGHRPDPRGELHVDQVPGAGAISLAWPHRRAPSRLHAQRRKGSRRKGRGRPADSPRHLPLARRGVRLPGGQAQIDSGRRPAPCWTTRPWCTSTSTPKPVRTRPAA